MTGVYKRKRRKLPIYLVKMKRGALWLENFKINSLELSKFILQENFRKQKIHIRVVLLLQIIIFSVFNPFNVWEINRSYLKIAVCNSNVELNVPRALSLTIPCVHVCLRKLRIHTINLFSIKLQNTFNTRKTNS